MIFHFWRFWLSNKNFCDINQSNPRYYHLEGYICGWITFLKITLFFRRKLKINLFFKRKLFINIIIYFRDIDYLINTEGYFNVSTKEFGWVHIISRKKRSNYLEMKSLKIEIGRKYWSLFISLFFIYSLHFFNWTRLGLICCELNTLQLYLLTSTVL